MKRTDPRSTSKSSPERKRSPVVRRRIAIIGAGRMGTALGIALEQRGFAIVAAVSRRRPHAELAARSIGPGVNALTIGQLEKLPPAELVIIATPDDAIPETASKLSVLPVITESTGTMLHMSGSLPSTILRADMPEKWSVGSLHPLLAVSEAQAGAAALPAAYFCVEGEARALREARSLVKAIGGKAISIKTQQKALYHAAAVMAAGHAVSLFDLAVEMLAQSGPGRKEAALILHSLMQSAIRDLGNTKPSKTMTGPFARGDVSTIEGHLAALEGRELSRARAAYLVLARHAVELAEGRLDRATMRLMRDLVGSDQ